jgi:hypothetical protein
MAFSGQDPLKCKIVVDNKFLYQVTNFIYVGCEISYKNEKDIQQKLAKFALKMGILNNRFKLNLVQKFSRMREYHALAVTILLYGTET